jgi:3-dehydroquinate synthase
MYGTIQQSIDVRFIYDVVFSRDIFAGENTALRDVLLPAISEHPAPAALVMLEDKVATLHAGLADRADQYLRRHFPGLRLPPMAILPGGEKAKTDPASISKILRHVASAGLDRHSFVMAIGGGAFLDATGYAASLVHRGLRMVRVPTTVLAQCDGGVGVKTAINDPAGKNFLGTFAPPYAVINDFNFLATLPEVEGRAGIAEAFKVAVIKDADFFGWLCEHAKALGARDEQAMEQLVYRCAELHLKHIRESGDPFEMGTARPLDYGHWSAHQLERMSGYAVGHGAAVAMGIALDALYAARTGTLAETVADQLIRGLADSGFTLWHDALRATDELLEGLESFREHLGGRLSITLPAGAGRSVEVSAVDASIMRACIEELSLRACIAPCT